ncbi:DUF2938 domain-containing protein [Marinicauda sp. Alg238-R41]|uniref:DUF2938 domain-containing protein n=1 Tax=Marinicauda sp. Alg238-R41 TaxID=2993447 RepID=UPI0022E8C11B|nr:DUF2938 domain-containing protein [Marinicauda sp. Alg238-R41]
MSEILGVGFVIVLLGAGATAILDLWALMLRAVYGVASLEYRLVGRWLLRLAGGRFAGPALAQRSPVSGERPLGWAAHYAIGVVFAGALIAVVGPSWVLEPTPGPALAAGWISTLAPFLILQPVLGAGLFAARTPNPAQARARTLITHTVFGLGLYLTALALDSAREHQLTLPGLLG